MVANACGALLTRWPQGLSTCHLDNYIPFSFLNIQMNQHFTSRLTLSMHCPQCPQCRRHEGNLKAGASGQAHSTFFYHCSTLEESLGLRPVTSFPPFTSASILFSHRNLASLHAHARYERVRYCSSSFHQQQSFSLSLSEENTLFQG